MGHVAGSGGTTNSGFSGFTLNGDSKLTGNGLVLVPDRNSSAGSAFLSTALPVSANTRMTAAFSFQVGGRQRADGLTFVLQNDVDGARADAWSDALIDAGALAVDASDPHAGTDAESPLYAEPGEPPGEGWPIARLEALVDASADTTALLASAAASLGEPAPAVMGNSATPARGGEHRRAR